MVIVGNLMSQLYTDEVLTPVVRHFLRQNQCKYQAYDAKPEHISQDSAKVLSSEQRCAY